MEEIIYLKAICKQYRRVLEGETEGLVDERLSKEVIYYQQWSKIEQYFSLLEATNYFLKSVETNLSYSF